MKSERGITLVSLVLTIIIMLILASVSIKMVGTSLINKKDNIVNEYYSEKQNITDKIQKIEDEWNGVIN